MLFRNAVVFVLASVPASAQCPQWSGAFGSPTYGSNGYIPGIAVLTTATGPVLYASLEHPAGPGYPATNFVRWEGLDWVPLPPALASPSSLVAFDDGSGPALFGVGGGGVMRWNGTVWSQAGSGFFGPLNRLEVTRWNGVDTLFALGGPSDNGQVAQWNGSQWQTLGGNIPFLGSHSVESIESFTTPAGTHLYIGASFSVGGSALGRWDGSSWASIPGPGATILDLTVFDDGNGPALFLGGTFHSIFGGEGFFNIARWSGTAWSNLGQITDTGARVNTLQVHDDGSGPSLYVGGQFSRVADVYPWPSPGIARWNANGWTPVGRGFFGTSTIEGRVDQLRVIDLGAGPRLAATGGIWSFDGWWSRGPALWDGSSWRPLRPTGVIGGKVRVLRRIDAPPLGPSLWVGGEFAGVGSAPGARAIGRFDGVQWQGLDQGINGFVNAIEVFNVDGVPQVHAGGQFDLIPSGQVRGLVRWTGTEWVQVGGGVFGSTGGSGRVYALAAHAEVTGTPPSLFVAGEFSSTGGGSFVGIVRWNGTTWSSVGGGTTGQIFALAVFDEGSGPRLFAAGNFTSIGGGAAQHIARWDGSSWTTLGTGLNGVCHALTVHDDGSGPALYAGGEFTLAGGVSAARVARWKNGVWSALGAGVGTSSTEFVSCLASQGSVGFPNSLLLVGGTFASAGGLPASNLAGFSGTTWSAIDPLGTNGNVAAITTFNDGSASAPALYLGGGFSTVGGRSSPNFAKRFDPCASGAGTAYCLGDGSGTPCPCGNDANPGTIGGCINASGAVGTLMADGLPRLDADSLVLRATGLENRPMLFFQATTRGSGGAGIIFGDGLQCAAGVIHRLAVKWSSNGLCVYPEGSEVPVSVQGAVTTPGSRTYQAWYRDPSIGYCSPAVFNTTNGVEVEWTIANP